MARCPALPDLAEANTERFSIFPMGKGKRFGAPRGGAGFSSPEVVLSSAMSAVSKASRTSLAINAVIGGYSSQSLLPPLAKEVPEFENLGDIVRMVVSPKGEAREAADSWLRRISRIPAHPRAWGFVKGRSCIDMCRAHLVYWDSSGRGDVSYLSMDLDGFFPSITGEMVASTLSGHGFSDEECSRFVSDCMAYLGSGAYWLHAWCKALSSYGARSGGAWTALDRHVSAISSSAWIGSWRPDAGKGLPPEWEDETRKMHAEVSNCVFRRLMGLGRSVDQGSWFLPQGSPVSPAMSNLVAKVMDIRLSAYLEACGCYYTRYADDLTISWGRRKTRREIALIANGVSRVVASCGFSVKGSKTVVMGPGMRQSVLGYVMNSGRPTVSKTRRKSAERMVGELRKMSAGGWTPELERRANMVLGHASYLMSPHPNLSERISREVSEIVETSSSSAGRGPMVVFSGGEAAAEETAGHGAPGWVDLAHHDHEVW